MAIIEKEKALDVVRQMVADGQVSQEVAEKYFPELKESEGERTRKYIINHLQEHLKTVRKFLNNGMSAPFSCEEIKMLEASVAWLEKQGEQNLTLPKWKYKKDHTPLLKDSIILNKYGCVAKSPSGALVSDVWVIDYAELAKLPKEEIEKQSEKPVDKIKPKFKVGDVVRLKYGDGLEWLVKEKHEDGNYTIVCADRDDCVLLDDKWELVEQKPADKVKPKFEIGDLITNGILVGKIDRIYEWGYHVYFGDYYSDVPDVENWHKWTIQDAKDGDVLAAHECLVLFKEIDGLNIKCYCTYHYMGCNPSFYVNTLQNKTAFYPATKEQCDILMKAMTDAGYTFDFESKELKKIEEEVNGEDYGIDSLYHAQRILEKTLGKVDGYQSDDGILEHKCAISAVKKLYEQKPNWSEEDGKNLEKTIWYVEKGGKLVFAKTDKLVSWLKSLRPQWKPSEAQISALDFAIDCTVYPEFQDKRKVLIELLEQLKQL